VLMFVALSEFGLGWLIALGPEYTYEFWTFCLALWSGAVLLSFDFQRGLLRPLAVLPVTEMAAPKTMVSSAIAV